MVVVFFFGFFFFCFCIIASAMEKESGKSQPWQRDPSQMHGAEIIPAVAFCLPLNVRKEDLKAGKSLAPVTGTGRCTAERGSRLGMGQCWPHPGICVGSDRPGAHV